MDLRLAPSLLAADFSNLSGELESIKRGGAEYLHFDVMDGHFVPNISFGLTVLKSIRPVSDLIFDVHLMISEPLCFVEKFAQDGADIITVHLEALDKPEISVCLKQIRSLGKKAAFAVNPGTPVEDAFPYAELADMILLMSVEPGLGGQKLIPEALNKAEALSNYISRNNLKTDIEMDGGITLENLPDVLNAGVNIVVAGSSIFYNNETELRTAKFKDAMKLFIPLLAINNLSIVG